VNGLYARSDQPRPEREAGPLQLAAAGPDHELAGDRTRRP